VDGVELSAKDHRLLEEYALGGPGMCRLPPDLVPPRDGLSPQEWRRKLETLIGQQNRNLIKR
jgi:hypothetical protein